jgi:Tol biopolymer transport system component
MRRPRGLILIPLLVGLLAHGPAATAAFPGSNGRIAFTMFTEGDHEIFSMKPDGSRRINLTDNQADDFWPTWSADGGKIAFIRRFAVYTMNADGSGETRVIDARCVRCRSPAWSPDGRRIAFHQQVDGNMDIYVVNADGTALTRLTTHPATDVQPAWSPDGTRIAFKSLRHPHGDLFVMDADGSHVHPVTDHPGNDFGPDWSPDGRRIAFAGHRDGATEIYVIRADGSHERKLTDTPDAYESYPAWSPDGRKIAFGSLRRHFEIFVMRADGSGQRRLTEGRGEPSGPDWAPD